MQHITSPHEVLALAISGPNHLSDDEVAATQQSILEELHSISEESLTDLQHPNRHTIEDSAPPEHTRTAATSTTAKAPAHSGVALDRNEEANDEAHVSDSEPGSPVDVELSAPSSPAHDAIPTVPTSEAIAASLAERTPPSARVYTQLITTEPIPSLAEDAPQTEQRRKLAMEVAAGADRSQAKPIVAAETRSTVAAVTGLEMAVEATEAELLESGDVGVAQHSDGTNVLQLDAVSSDLLDRNDLSAEVEAGIDLDHTDLFDGIDADAFEDIELSPPVRRQATLPPLEDVLHMGLSQTPASPTRTRNPKAAQPPSGLELTLGGNHALAFEPPEMPQPSQMASFLDPAFAGFQTLRGKQVKPSEKALEAARKLLLDLEESQDLLPPPPASQSASQLRSRTITSRPSEPQPPTNGGIAKTEPDRAPMQEIAPRQSSAAINGSQRQSPSSEGKLAQTPLIMAAQVGPASQLERQPSATPKPMRDGLFSGSQSLASPIRTPAFAASGARFTTPQPSKRVSLGMMPRVEIGGSTGRKRTLPKFVTPFKSGKRPRPEEQQDPASPLRRVNDGAQSLSTPTSLANRRYPPTRTRTVQASTSSEGPAVFRLQSDQPRQKLSQIGRPEYYSALQMIAKGVPDEVLVILNDASRAAQYAFEAPNGDLLMQSNALDDLHARGCTNANLPWVQNHWTLVLWKLAAMVRLEPSSAQERWSWDELMRQLLYRYEREVHSAQRSCLKRIQEHDSSPARPMVLFVSKILEEENEVQDKAGEILLRKSTLLELSDGWYRMQAQIDPVLTAACQRGRLRVGQKLAIMGATLDAQDEGNEVLAAYHMSSLVLASNSVSLAPWDAKLGFTATPFFASLRSLTAEGGLVSLMDVVITKIFPLAYIDAERSSKPGNPRGEQEEVEEREKWTKKREDAIARLELETESENRRLYDLIEALGDLASDTFLPAVPHDPSGQLEALASNLFDQLRSQANPASSVNQMVVAAGHSSLVPWLHNLARGAIMAEEGTGASRLGATLDRLCPPRKVREFRVVRFRDARLPPSPPHTAATTAAAAATQSSTSGGAKRKNPHARTVQLTVWDAAQLGDELQEGRRFWVTNLVPSSKTAWRKPDDAADVFLSTRRDTKWRPV